ncbi:MAG: dihydrofolate reductase [Candidatus Roizmanbacteria bacterium]
MIALIACISKNRGLGYKNKLLWKISEDLKFFRDTTLHHPIIMGRKTYESIGKPLPNRTNIVVSRNKALVIQGCIVVDSLEKAIVEAQKINKTIFIIGGSEIYKQGIVLADTLYLTCINADAPQADSFFPEFADAFSHKEVLMRGNHEHITFEIKKYTRGSLVNNINSI